MLLPLLAPNLHLSLMASSEGKLHIFLADELLPGVFAVGVVDVSELVEGSLVSCFGRKLPVADSNFIIAKAVILDAADAVAGRYASSQRADSLKQSGPFLIDSHSVTLVVDNPNLRARCRRTKINGPDVAIECLQVIFGQSKSTYLVSCAHKS